ncbi:MAG: N-acetyl-gamma-glutamyl-phosphate reductase [Moraxellaceae bacterium]|nr:N-acetyl-gamma-glutamyl-phosphate reductase [Moraxellaceae bacterium]
MSKKKVGIVGGTGYTGVELIRLLSSHVGVELAWITSRSEAGKPVTQVFPNLRGVTDLIYQDFGGDSLAMMSQADLVFFATPHGVAMKQTPSLVKNGVKVIDLGADFRLQSLVDFEHWYQHIHACPDLLKTAVYGLPEINREKIAKANIIANPGCYPTTAILGLKPIIETQNAHFSKTQRPLIERRIIIDAKSGVSGAGRQGKLALNYAEVTDNFKAYGVDGHRHLPEIEQGINLYLESKISHNVRFLPHLVPMIRGMYSSIHISLTEAGTQINWQEKFAEIYQNEPFIDVLETGIFPETRTVRASNQLRIAICQNNDRQELTIMVVQDNLVKGASGQAIQNMNIIFGFAENMGLKSVAVIP